MTTKALKLILTAFVPLAFAASVWAQQPVPGAQPAPKKNPFMIDVKIGNSAYIPMGINKPARSPFSRDGYDPAILSVAMRNMTALEIKNVNVEAIIYKLNTQGKIAELAKVRQTLDFKRGELKVVYANGELSRPYRRSVDIVRYGNTTTTRREPPHEEIYGWYLRVFLDNEQVCEKANHPSLAGSDEVQKSLKSLQPRR